MSIHRLMRRSGERFLVRYRDREGVNRSRTFATQQEAERFQRQVDVAKSQRRVGELQVGPGRF